MKKIILAIIINLLCFLNYGNVTLMKFALQQEMKVLNLAIQKVKLKA